ncbi:MAG: flagellar biosynthesis anti-sigma factor FlgM [Lachnospiraceae bacterium]|nr:flagellar biosynthesis anti-sigma factor FlgM [Candidatus Colinaster scatohippi]
MRIEAYTQVQQLYNKNSTKQLKKETGSSRFSDQLQISSMGKDIQIAKQAVAGAADIREDLVASIKSRVDNGTYEVDSTSLAERLYQKYSAF